MTEQPLEGAEFRVETVQGAPADDNEGQTSTNGIYRTDENGRFTLSKLQPGIYVVTETKAPEGYVLDATPKTVTVNANDAQTVTFRDTPLQTLVIQKYADGTSNPLAGVTFLLTDANGAKIGVGEYVTDENGRIVVGGLQPGLTVVAREIRTVEGYHLNTEPQTVRISANGETSLLSATPVSANGNSGGNSMTFYDTPLASLLIHSAANGRNQKKGDTHPANVL